jgi:hypothetical protein
MCHAYQSTNCDVDVNVNGMNDFDNIFVQCGYVSMIKGNVYVKEQQQKNKDA